MLEAPSTTPRAPPPGRLHGARNQRSSVARQQTCWSSATWTIPTPSRVRCASACEPWGINPGDVKKRARPGAPTAFLRVIPHSDGAGSSTPWGPTFRRIVSASACGASVLSLIAPSALPLSWWSSRLGRRFHCPTRWALSRAPAWGSRASRLIARCSPTAPSPTRLCSSSDCFLAWSWEAQDGGGVLVAVNYVDHQSVLRPPPRSRPRWTQRPAR
jgi:hypothetical protein